MKGITIEEKRTWNVLNNEQVYGLYKEGQLREGDILDFGDKRKRLINYVGDLTAIALSQETNEKNVPYIDRKPFDHLGRGPLMRAFPTYVEYGGVTHQGTELFEKWKAQLTEAGIWEAVA